MLAGTPASIVCGSAGDDCGDLSWTQCFDQFCVNRICVNLVRMSLCVGVSFL